MDGRSRRRSRNPAAPVFGRRDDAVFRSRAARAEVVAKVDVWAGRARPAGRGPPRDVARSERTVVARLLAPPGVTGRREYRPHPAREYRGPGLDLTPCWRRSYSLTAEPYPAAPTGGCCAIDMYRMQPVMSHRTLRGSAEPRCSDSRYLPRAGCIYSSVRSPIKMADACPGIKEWRVDPLKRVSFSNAPSFNTAIQEPVVVGPSSQRLQGRWSQPFAVHRPHKAGSAPGRPRDGGGV